MKMNLNKYKEYNYNTKAVTFLVIMYPLLSVYGMPPFNLGMVTMPIFYFLFLVPRGKFILKWPKYFWLFFVYMFLLRLFNGFDANLSDMFSLNLISFGISLGISCKYIDLEYGRKLYKNVVFICCIFFFFQEAMFMITGARVVGLLSWIPLNTGVSNFDYISLLSTADRSASFFLEPAHFAQYLLPLLAIELFINKKPVINFYTLLITFTLLLLRSGIGVTIMAIIWILWVFYFFSKSPIKYKIIGFVLILPIFFFSSYLFINSNFGKSFSSRQSEVTDSSEISSGYVRIIRGYELYSDFPIFNKLFGLNPPSKLITFISKGEMSFLFSENDLLFSGIQSILIFGGIIGLLIFLFHFFYLLRNNYRVVSIVGIVFSLMSLMSPIYLMGEMLLCYSLMYSYRKADSLNKLGVKIKNK